MSLKAVRPSILVVSFLLAMAGGLRSEARQPQQERVALAGFIERYIELSNARDLQGLASLYAPQPEVIQEGETLEGDFMDNLVENLETWDKYEVVWSVLEIGSIEVEPERAVLEFRIEGKGRAWLIPVSKTFEKRLVLRPSGDGTGWKIEKDVTL